MEMESIWMGKGAGQMAQRAAHGTTRNNSKHDHYLKSRWISTDGAIARCMTHLGHPHHFPSTTDRLLIIQTHRVVMDDSRNDLEDSITPGGPTRPHRRVEAESGELNAQICRIQPGNGAGAILSHETRRRKCQNQLRTSTHLDSSTTTS